jgi:hypothetical protein
MRIRAAVVAGVLVGLAAPVLGEESSTGDTVERISASVIAHELEAMSFTAKIDQDDTGDPRVTTKVDGFEWSIYFYDCASGVLAERGCASYQFYTGYIVPASFPLTTINKWNTEKRYAKAYSYVQRDHSNNARIELDVLLAGTGADPAKSFRANFVKMRNAAEGFRKAIGFQK